MRYRALFTLLLLAILLGIFSHTSSPAQAQSTTDTSTDQLDQQIKAKQARVKELEGVIGNYQDTINAQEQQKTSLENEVLILDNQATQKQLAIEQTQAQLEAIQLEINQLEKSITEQNAHIITQKDLVAGLVRQINQDDRVPAYEVLLTQPSLSSFFDQVENTKRLDRDLGDALDKLKASRETLTQNKKDRDDKRLALEAEKKKLNEESLALEAERNFKLSLIHETDNKQEEFQRVLYELQQQQQGTADDIATLETTLKDKLNAIDDSLAKGDDLLNWPVDPARGITATFHDPTYPFRNLFPHPGVDVRASVGTTVHAAAGGYVAWNKQGRMYGNYTMVVHPGNIATVYAHLSKFIAQPDTYIQRGDAIGLSGGMPGQPGAGLSTGPHVHFEVRQNGIPVDPENFLPTPPGQ